MRKILLAVCILLMASVASAQTTAVQATVTDPKGVPYAYGTVKVSLTASGTEYLNGYPYTPPPVSSLDSFGRFTLQLADNNILQPAGSSYSFLICSSTNGIVPPFSATPTCFSVAGIKATGTVNNLTSTLSASATDLNVGGVSSWSQIQALLTGSCNSTTAVFGDGSCQVPAGGGNVSNSGTPTSGQLGIWTSATQLSGATASQDCTVSSLGVFTCTKTNNVAFAASATTDATNATNINSGTLSALRLPTIVSGSNTQVQFNDAGAFGGDAGLTYNKITKVLTVAGALNVTPSGGVGASWVCQEGTDPGSEAAGVDVLWCSSGTHQMMLSLNNGSSLPLATIPVNLATQVTGTLPASSVGATSLTAGTSVTLSAPRQYFVCTGACTITVPVPAAGDEFCVLNDDNVATVITFAAIGSSARYENTARTAYGTAGTGTLVSGGAVGDKMCLLGRDATHYLVASFNGTWTAN